MLQKVLKEKELEQLYLWVDGIPLSRPKKNMARDFSDAGTFYNIFPSSRCRNCLLPLPKTRGVAQLHFYWQLINKTSKLENSQWQFLCERKDKVLKKLKIILTKEEILGLANCESFYAQRLIFLIKKSIQEQPQLSQISRVTKSSKLKQILLPVSQQQKKPKTLTFKQILNIKEVREIVTSKDQQIQGLKQTLELYALKFAKLDEIVKSKDKQIQQLVKKIKNKGIM